MFKKSVIIVSVILISLAFVDVAFGSDSILSEHESDLTYNTEQPVLIYYNDVFESPLSIEQSVRDYPLLDADSDGLSNGDELIYGTNPILADTDDDFILDGVEVKFGLNPVSWDTDGDKLADYIEIDYLSKNFGTSPFESDSDHDGLPDPWEDNDGDTILNIEEQDPKFKYGILGTNPNEIDSDGDNVRDQDEAQVNAAGPISENSKNQAGYTQLPVTPDRTNANLDVSNVNSPLSKHLKNELGWTNSDLEYWDQGLKLAFVHGVLSVNQSSTVWYHYSPFLIPMPVEYNWSGGPPFRWNKYDTNPALNDTDGDVMDDDWDPRPLKPDDRLDSYVAIRSIRHNGIDYDAQAPNNQNFTSGLDANFTALEVTKGDEITLTLWLGLENTPDNDPIKIPQNWWSPLNVSIRFALILLGADNVSHGPADFRGDDIWPIDLNSTAFPEIPDKPWVSVGSANYKGSDGFTNSTGQPSTMYFYEQIISIYLPADLPAGIVAFIVKANPNTGENFYYESYTWPFVGY
jgi:hypothetical protein